MIFYAIIFYAIACDLITREILCLYTLKYQIKYQSNNNSIP